MEDAKIPAAAIERKGEQAQKKHKAELKIQHMRELFSPPPERAQQIIIKPQSPAKEQGPGKLGKLPADRQLHQPNSRLKKPPVTAVS